MPCCFIFWSKTFFLWLKSYKGSTMDYAPWLDQGKHWWSSKGKTRTSCLWLFRIYRGFSRGSLAVPLGIQIALYTEILGSINVVDLASFKGRFPFWIEIDSSLLVSKVTSKSIDVPWKRRLRWRRCLDVRFANTFSITHIFREGNQVADKLANVGYIYWTSLGGMVFQLGLLKLTIRIYLM